MTKGKGLELIIIHHWDIKNPKTKRIYPLMFIVDSTIKSKDIEEE
jgi:hypothetical protein